MSKGMALANAVLVGMLVTGTALMTQADAAAEWLVAGTTAPESPSTSGPTSEPSHDPSAPQRIGPWSMTVLETQRGVSDALSGGTEELQPGEVLITAQLTNTSLDVQEATLLEILFGSDAGTDDGYALMDDWCVPVREDLYEWRTAYLPGESRVVHFCVSVKPIDAPDLSMTVMYYDGNTVQGQADFALPPDGKTAEPEPLSPFSVTHAAALNSSRTSGYFQGQRYSVSEVTVESSEGDTRPYRITLTIEAPDATDGVEHYSPTGLGPSGEWYFLDPCEEADPPTAAPAHVWATHLCADVKTEDAGAILLYLSPEWVEEPGLILDGRP